MGTATALSTALPAGEELAGHAGLALRHGVRPRPEGRLETTFDIAPRRAGEELPARDANRAGAMRRIARAFLSFHSLTHMEFAVSLIVSELITNAVMHSQGTKVEFTLAFQDDRLHIAVRNDRAGIRTPARHASIDDEHGRGLQLVALIVTEAAGTWGIEGDGMTVSCSLPITGGPQ